VTKYFDDAVGQVTEYADTISDDDTFWRGVCEVEVVVIEEVRLNTGDREFPEDLREKIMTAISVDRAYVSRRVVTATRMSTLLGSLHALFHDLAARRIETRFGRWSDDPRGNLRSRRVHDQDLGRRLGLVHSDAL